MNLKTASLTMVFAAAVFSSGAQASVSQIGSQAAFSAAGTILQNTNWDSYGSGFSYPGSPFTVGDLTFVEGGQNLIGGTGTDYDYDLARNLFTDNSVRGTTAQVAGSYDLLGFNAGNFYGTDSETFSITTNLGSYSFVETVNTAVSQAPLTFFGFQAGAGEHITSFAWSGAGATGLTDIQLGTAVPEASTWVMMLAGFAGLGFLGYRRNKVVSVAG
jgi:hypothetical protein